MFTMGRDNLYPSKPAGRPSPPVEAFWTVALEYSFGIMETYHELENHRSSLAVVG